MNDGSATVGLLTLVLGVAPLRRMFGFKVPPLGSALDTVGVGAAVLVLLLLQKRWGRVN